MPAIGDVVLDTSVAVAHLRGVAAVTERLTEHKTLYLPLVALGELYYGIRRSGAPERNLEGLRRWLNTVRLLTLNEGICDEYGRIKDELARAGTPIPENDIWIAAVARSQGLPLAARDDHFQNVRGLNLLDWA